MKKLLINLKTPAIISFLLVLPFILMELVNRRAFQESFPIPLFVFLWLLPVLFFLVRIPLVRAMRASANIFVNPFILLARVAALVLTAALFIGIIFDQLPCFMGVQFCD